MTLCHFTLFNISNIHQIELYNGCLYQQLSRFCHICLFFLSNIYMYIMHIYTYIDIFIYNFLFYKYCVILYILFYNVFFFHLRYIVNIVIYSLKKLYRYYMLIVEKPEITDMQKENIVAPNLTSRR